MSATVSRALNVVLNMVKKLNMQQKMKEWRGTVEAFSEIRDRDLVFSPRAVFCKKKKGCVSSAVQISTH